MPMMDKKILSSFRAAQRYQSAHQARHLLQARRDRGAINFVERVSALGLRVQQPGALHGLQMSRDDRAVLRQGLRNRSDIRTALQHKLAENFNACRLAQGTKKICVQNVNARVGGVGAGHHFGDYFGHYREYIGTLMHTSRAFNIQNQVLQSTSLPATIRAMEFKPLVTLLAIVNPLAIVPFFIHYTQGYSAEERLRTIWIASLSAFCVIAISALAGLKILDFFSISLASFQVGGGMLLLTSSLAMLNAEPAEAKSTINEIKEEIKEAQTDSRPHNHHAITAARTSIAVVPLTIPLLTGPATMSTVVIYAEKAKTFPQLATLVGYGVVIALATAVCFAAAQPIARLLGSTGINVMTRLMGLILAALSVEVMSEGLIKLFPILGR